MNEISFLKLHVWRLGLFLFLSWGSWSSLEAQVNNDSIYKQLIKEFTVRHPGPYKALEGRMYKDYLPEIKLDSTRNDVLTLQGLQIQYNPLGNKRYLRLIQVPLKIEGEQLLHEVLNYQDTLSGKVLRKLIKTCPEPFKGEDPSSYSRWLKPSLLIGGSILGILGLFFIRSA